MRSSFDHNSPLIVTVNIKHPTFKNYASNSKNDDTFFFEVTTGKIGIDLERTLKINQEQDPNVWKTDVDPK